MKPHNLSFRNAGSSAALALAVFILVPSFPGWAQSTDRDHPTPLTVNEIKGRSQKEQKEFFWSFEAGPGEMTCTLNVMRDAPGAGTDSKVALSFFDRDASNLLEMSIWMYAATSLNEQTVRRLTFKERQTLMMRVTTTGGETPYRIRFSGAVSLGAAPATPPAPPPPAATPSEPKTLSAAEMEKQIQEKGQVSVYGINFDTGKADVRKDSVKVLAEIGKLLIKNDAMKLRIEGHTDNVGSAEMNLKLSKERAAKVKTYLVETFGIDAGRLTTEGYGFSKPVASNDTELGRALNRRVELVKQ